MNSPKVEPLSKELAKIYRKCANALTDQCAAAMQESNGTCSYIRFGTFFDLFQPADLEPEEKRLALLFMAAMIESGDA